MANKKITDLVDIGTPASGDLLEIVDISEGVSKRVAVSALGGGSTPTLQEVLDNNHDLVDGNFFAGTDAGISNSGNNVNAFGELAAEENSGNYVNSIGWISGFGNTGDNNNFLGTNSGGSNTGSSINAMGGFSLQGNTGNDVNALGYEAGIGNTYDNVNLFGENAQADENGQTVLSKDGTIMARISTADLADTRKYNLPDADGTLALTSDIPTIDATPTDGSANAVSSNGVFDALALKCNKPLVDTVSSSALTGVTTEGILKSYLIPANTLTASEILNFANDLYKTGTAGICTSRLYTNTTASLSGASLLATSTSTAGNRKMPLRRQLVLKGGNIEVLAATASTPDDNINSSSVATIVTFNPAVDNYLITTAQNANAGDSTLQNNLKLHY